MSTLDAITKEKQRVGEAALLQNFAAQAVHTVQQ
jgi:hypothetical protein